MLSYIMSFVDPITIRENNQRIAKVLLDYYKYPSVLNAELSNFLPSFAWMRNFESIASALCSNNQNIDEANKTDNFFQQDINVDVPSGYSPIEQDEKQEGLEEEAQNLFPQPDNNNSYSNPDNWYTDCELQRELTIPLIWNEMKVGKNEYVWKYENCNKKFTKAYNLIYHLRVHTGEKPFTCRFCNKKFSQKGNLGRHLERHEKESVEDRKIYQCDICSKSYTSIYNLRVSSAI